MSYQERKDFNAWWDGDIKAASNPYRVGSPAFWAWEGWQARAALAQQAVPDGWKLTAVSDGDVRVYGPDKETWLIRKDCGEGFYDFIYRFFEAMIAAAPAAPQAEQQDERDLAINAETCAVCGEGKALLVRSCSCCGSLYAGSAEMRENQKQAGQAPAVGAEPVAKVVSWTNGSYWRNYKLTWMEGGDYLDTGALLYATPPDHTAAMRQALEALVGNCTNPAADPEQAAAEDAAIAKLRAALGESKPPVQPMGGA